FAEPLQERIHRTGARSPLHLTADQAAPLVKGVDGRLRRLGDVGVGQHFGGDLTREGGARELGVTAQIDGGATACARAELADRDKPCLGRVREVGGTARYREQTEENTVADEARIGDKRLRG